MPFLKFKFSIIEVFSESDTQNFTNIISDPKPAAVQYDMFIGLNTGYYIATFHGDLRNPFLQQ